MENSLYIYIYKVYIWADILDRLNAFIVEKREK